MTARCCETSSFVSFLGCFVHLSVLYISTNHKIKGKRSSSYNDWMNMEHIQVQRWNCLVKTIFKRADFLGSVIFFAPNQSHIKLNKDCPMHGPCISVCPEFASLRILVVHRNLVSVNWVTLTCVNFEIKQKVLKPSCGFTKHPIQITLTDRMFVEVL